VVEYTVCFIKRGSQILMLNRNSSPFMGMWDGVGGKIEENETPSQCAIREIAEETGIEIAAVDVKGRITWTVNGKMVGLIYIIVANLPENFDYETPKKMEEGILDWKEIEWILDRDNQGVVSNVPLFLPTVLNDPKKYEYKCSYEDGNLISFEAIPLAETFAYERA
jgi:8-oxo-dGTP diphosphatase